MRFIWHIWNATSKAKVEAKGAFQKSELTGGTNHFDNDIGFYKELFLKNRLLRACYLGFEWSGWIVLIKSEILVTTRMVWAVSFDKWKAL